MEDEETGKEKPYTIEEYKEKLAAALIEQVENIDLLREMWVNRSERKHLIVALPGGEKGALMLRELLDLEDCDLYDFFADVGFGIDPKTREERVLAFDYKNKEWLMSLPSESAKVIKSLARQFKERGIDELETPDVFNIPEIKRVGGVKALSGIGINTADVLTDVKERLLIA